MKLSVIIATNNNPNQLWQCCKCLEVQSCKDFETIIIDEPIPLVEARNKGMWKAKGELISFIDDDSMLHKDWVGSVIDTFKDPTIGGVTGPTLILSASLKNRDVFRIPALLKKLVMGKQGNEIGKLLPSGLVSLGSNFPEKALAYQGEVDYLEACNMSFRGFLVKQLLGFSPAFGGCGDWSEPDLALRVKQLGFKLWFNPKVLVFHNIQPKRRSRGNFQRLKNFILFNKKWNRFSLRYLITLVIISCYYAYKSARRI